MDTIWFFWLCTVGVVHFFTFIPWMEFRQMVKKAIENRGNRVQLELDQHTREHFIRKRDEAWMSFLLLYHQISWCVIMMDMITLIYVNNTSGNARILAVSRGFTYALVTVVATYYRRIGMGQSNMLIFKMPEGLAKFMNDVLTPSRRADIAYGAVMIQATSIGFAFSSCTSGGNQISAVCRLLVSVINRNTKQALMWNLLSVITSLIVVHSGLTDCEVIYLHYLSPEILTFILIVAATRIMEQLAIAEASSATKALSRQNECAAFSAILNAMCDAVVHLNGHGLIQGPAPKLASLLLHNVATPTLDGKPFRSLLATEQERESMGKLLDEHDSDFATAFRVNVRDQAGSVVYTRGFHTRYTDMDGEIGHLIGLSEVSDSQEALTQPRSGKDDRPESGAGSGAGAGAASPVRVRAAGGVLDFLQAGDSFDAEVQSSLPDDERLSNRSPHRRMLPVDGELALQDQLETTQVAKEMTLWHTVLGWNFYIPRGACCHFHAASQELRRVTASLSRSPCLTSSSLHLAATQCQGCGLLNTRPCPEDPERCSECMKWQPPKSEPPATPPATVGAGATGVLAL